MSWLWTAVEHSGDTTLRADVPAGSTAFIDGGSEGRLWGRVYRTEPGADQLAAAEFAATALAAAALAPGPASGRQVAVLGEGMLARLIRASLSAGALFTVPGRVSPSAVAHGCDLIDTTGSTGVLSQAVRTLPRLGRLILAAPPCPAEIMLATYSDVHVRGLSLVGVPWTGRIPARVVADPRLAALTEVALAGMRYARPGVPVPGSLLYVLAGGTSA